jgi:hypothetical protein
MLPLGFRSDAKTAFVPALDVGVLLNLLVF